MEKLFEAIERFRILCLNADHLMTDLKEARLKAPEINRISIEDAERGNKRNIQRLKFQSNEIPYNLYYQAINDLRNMYKYDKGARETLYNDITTKIEDVMTLYNDLVKKHNVYHVDNVTRKYRDFFEVSKGFRELYNYYFSIKEIKDFQTSKGKAKTFPDYLKHDKPEALAEALKKEFQGKRGRAIAFMIHVLNEKGKITDSKFYKKDLYEAIRIYFGTDIGTDTSINKVMNTHLMISDISYHKDEHKKMDNLIDSIL